MAKGKMAHPATVRRPPVRVRPAGDPMDIQFAFIPKEERVIDALCISVTTAGGMPEAWTLAKVVNLAGGLNDFVYQVSGVVARENLEDD